MIALESSGRIVYQGSWSLKLQEMIGLVGNKQPKLPFDTSLGTLRNVRFAKPVLDKYQVAGTETGEVKNNEWLITSTAKDISVESAKVIAKNEVSQKRYEVENGGIFLNNKFYATDRDSQSAISRMTGTIAWKAAATVVKDEKTFISDSEFVDTDMDALKTAVAAHVAAAYAKEKEFVIAINAADTIAALRLIDLTSGWTEVPLRDF
jgi:hypothetical protein